MKEWLRRPRNLAFFVGVTMGLLSLLFPWMEEKPISPLASLLFSVSAAAGTFVLERSKRSPAFKSAFGPLIIMALYRAYESWMRTGSISLINIILTIIAWGLAGTLLYAWRTRHGREGTAPR